MEILTIILTILLTAATPVGLVVNNVVENRLSSRFNEVEELEVRVNSTPSYQLLQGKVDRVRIASRGVQLTPNLQVDTLELETDPFRVDLERLRQGGQNVLQEAFNEPFQGGVRLVLTEENLNTALASPAIQARIQVIVNQIGEQLPGDFGQNYTLLNPQIQLLENGRVQFGGNLQVSRENRPPQTIPVSLEAGLNVIQGQRIELVNPTASLAGRPLPPFFISSFASRIGDRANLSILEDAGILARILNLDVNENNLELVTFIRVESNP